MIHPPNALNAQISEVFSSLQGEGTRLGERHLFVRFEECPLHCEYCDEAKSGDSRSLEELMGEIAAVEKEEGPHAFVSLTGGEPLAYPAFLQRLLPRLKAAGFRVYLETSGVLRRALEAVIGWCDVIAMDMKPASVTKERSFEAEHRRFLGIARAKEVFVKIVLSREIDAAEFENLIRIVEETAPRTPVILQPVSGSGTAEGHEDPELMALLGRLQRLALGRVADVRIVPRLHRILKIR